LHEIEWKNNGFLFTTPNIYIYIYVGKIAKILKNELFNMNYLYELFNMNYLLRMNYKLKKNFLT